MTKVLTFGTFDNFHPGHEFFLNGAQKKGELWIAIARDETVGKMKGKQPKHNEEARMQAVQEAFPDAHVLLGDSHKYLVPLQTVQPDLVVLGYDQKLPAGISEDDIPCPIVRLPAYKPEKYKSSLI